MLSKRVRKYLTNELPQAICVPVPMVWSQTIIHYNYHEIFPDILSEQNLKDFSRRN